MSLLEPVVISKTVILTEGEPKNKAYLPALHQ